MATENKIGEAGRAAALPRATVESLHCLLRSTLATADAAAEMTGFDGCPDLPPDLLWACVHLLRQAVSMSDDLCRQAAHA